MYKCKAIGKRVCYAVVFISRVLFDVSTVVIWYWVVAVMVYVAVYEP